MPSERAPVGVSERAFRLLRWMTGNPEPVGAPAEKEYDDA